VTVYTYNSTGGEILDEVKSVIRRLVSNRMPLL
jgi:hypothetical protein